MVWRKTLAITLISVMWMAYALAMYELRRYFSV